MSASKGWTPEKIELCKDALSRATTLGEAAQEIGCARSTMVEAFKRANEPHPSTFLLAADLVEKFKAKREDKAERKEVERALKMRVTIEEIEKFADLVFAGRMDPAPMLKLKSAPTARINNAVLSDLHIGSDIKKKYTGVSDFGVAEEARCMAHIFSEICDYKMEHRSETELELLLLGDTIEGDIHNQGQDEIARQVCRAIHLLEQGIALCAARYKTVRVRCVTGNHGRTPMRSPQRETYDKAGSYETMIYYAVMKACSRLKNVSFDIPETPYVTYDVFGQRIFATHGDTVATAGNPGKNLNIGSLESQINRFNATLHDTEEYKVFIMGHVHTPVCLWLPNGTVVLVNGAMCPVGGHAVGWGLLESARGQWIFESVKKFPLGDSRLIRLDREIDSNVALGKLITPFGGLSAQLSI